MEQTNTYGRYWIWKDQSVGAQQDNYQTVTGTEFITAMEEPGRYFIRLKGETPDETIYIETTLEEWKRWTSERKRAQYQKGLEREVMILPLDAPESGVSGEGVRTIAETLIGDMDISRGCEQEEFYSYMNSLMEKWPVEDRYIAIHRFLAQEPASIQSIATEMGLAYTVARRRTVRVRGRLIRAMKAYDPELLEAWMK